MSAIALNRVVTQVGTDPKVRAALVDMNQSELARMGLSAEQMEALLALDVAALLRLGLRPGLCMSVQAVLGAGVFGGRFDASEYFSEIEDAT